MSGYGANQDLWPNQDTQNKRGKASLSGMKVGVRVMFMLAPQRFELA